MNMREDFWDTPQKNTELSFPLFCGKAPLLGQAGLSVFMNVVLKGTMHSRAAGSRLFYHAVLSWLTIQTGG